MSPTPAIRRSASLNTALNPNLRSRSNDLDAQPRANESNASANPDAAACTVSSSTRRSASPKSHYAKQLSQFLKKDNWVAVFNELSVKLPNLCRLISAIHNRIPRDYLQGCTIAGFRVTMTAPGRSYFFNHLRLADSKPETTTVNAPMAQGIQAIPLRRNSTGARSQSGINSPSQGSGSVTAGAQGELHDNHSMSHTDALAIMTLSLLKADDVPPVQDPSDSASVADLCPDISESALAHALHELNRSSTSTELSPSVSHAVAHRTTPEGRATVVTSTPVRPRSHPLSLNPFGMLRPYLRDQRTSLLDQPGAAAAQVADAVERAALTTALMLRQTTGRITADWELASEEWLSQHEVELQKNEQAEGLDSDGISRLATFCPGIRRRVMLHDGESAPQFAVTEAGTVRLVNEEETVLTHCRQMALRHLQAPRPSLETADLFPLFVYRALAQSNGLTIPAVILERESQRLQSRQNARDEAETEQRANAARVADAQAKTRAYQASRLARQTACAEAHQLIGPQVADFFLIYGGGHPNMINASIEFSFLLETGRSDRGLFPLVRSAIERTHTRQEISSRMRRLNPETGRVEARSRDDLCWLRGLWISALFSAPTPEYLPRRIAELGTRSLYSGLDAAAVLQALWSDFRLRRGDLLHPGEEAGPSKPAHILCTRKLVDYVASKGIAGPTLPGLNKTVEQWLFDVTIGVSMGARGTEKPRFSANLMILETPFNRMDSDFVLSTHRVLEIPCCIIERKLGGFTTIKFSGARTDARLQGIATDLTRKSSEQTLNIHDLSALLHHYRNVPILELLDDHFTVYLPNAAQTESTSPPPGVGQPHPGSLTPPPHSRIHVHVNGTLTAILANQVQFHAGRPAIAVGQTATEPSDALAHASLIQQNTHTNSPSGAWFEFVSPRARTCPEQAHYPGTIHMLQTQLERVRTSGRSLVMNDWVLSEIRPVQSSADRPWLERFELHWHRPFRPHETACSVAWRASPETLRGCLSSEDLLACVNLLGDATSPPSLMSPHGLVRSGALAVALAAKTAIRRGELTHSDAIDEWFEQAMTQGRIDRGPFFMHNEAQREQVKRCIRELMRLHSGHGPGGARRV